MAPRSRWGGQGLDPPPRRAEWTVEQSNTTIDSMSGESRTNGDPPVRFSLLLTDKARRDLHGLPTPWARSCRIAFQRLEQKPLPDGLYRVEARVLPFRTVVPGERFCRYAYDRIVIDYSVFEQFDLVVVHRISMSLSL